MNTLTRLPKHCLDRQDLPALRERWSETVRYEIYARVGERHDVRKIERAVFQMLLGHPGRVEDTDEADIDDVVSRVCEEYGSPPWFDWDEYLTMHPEREEEDDAV
jgi:hypothetical protein